MRISDPPNGSLLYGRFEVQSVLGQGAFARVYKALDRKTGRLCALKRLYHTDARHVREAENVQKVRSPNVVVVDDFGVEEGDLVWIAMELLEGTTLAAHLRKEAPLRAVRVLQILGQLCAGLSAAHAQGVVHRDLKPENIFLHEVGDGPRRRTVVKILDFGLSKRVSTNHIASMSKILGTPAYMAPEQWVAGRNSDRSTDVWALGLIAFEMLTGKRYWRAVYEAPSDELALRDEVIRGTLVAPSVRARELGSAVQFTPQFESWFGRCVCQDQRLRFLDAAEAGKALPTRLVEGDDSIFDDLPSMAVVEPPAPLLAPPPSRRRMVLAVATTGVIAAMTGAVLALADPSDSQETFADCPEGMTLVRSQRLPGSNVPVASFCIDAAAVTVEEYSRCVRNGICPAAAMDSTGLRGVEGRAMCNYGVEGRAARPMNCIDSRRAFRFCDSRAARLPTAAEWSLGVRGAGPLPWAGGALAELGFRCARDIGVPPQ